MNRLNRSIIRATVFAYAIALWLPSYSFSNVDLKIDINQIGFQSLFAPDMGISKLANYLYFGLLAMSIRDSVPRATRIWLSSILLALLAAIGFLHMFGELAPGSSMHIGPGAFVWFFALGIAAVANLLLKRQAPSSNQPAPSE